MKGNSSVSLGHEGMANVATV